MPDSDDWISLAEAGRLRGVSRQAISKLVKQGRLESTQMAGYLLVSRKQVLAFERRPAGRPPKDPK